jgi:hypothetical protein
VFSTTAEIGIVNVKFSWTGEGNTLELWIPRPPSQFYDVTVKTNFQLTWEAALTGTGVLKVTAARFLLQVTLASFIIESNSISKIY